MSTYHQAAGRRRMRDARAGLIPSGWTFQPGPLESWCADQLGDQYERADAVALAQALREQGMALAYRHAGRPGHLLQSARIPVPITELLP